MGELLGGQDQRLQPGAAEPVFGALAGVRKEGARLAGMNEGQVPDQRRAVLMGAGGQCCSRSWLAQAGRADLGAGQHVHLAQSAAQWQVIAQLLIQIVEQCECLLANGSAHAAGLGIADLSGTLVGRHVTVSGFEGSKHRLVCQAIVLLHAPCGFIGDIGPDIGMVEAGVRADAGAVDGKTGKGPGGTEGTARLLKVDAYQRQVWVDGLKEGGGLVGDLRIGQVGFQRAVASQPPDLTLADRNACRAQPVACPEDGLFEAAGEELEPVRVEAAGVARVQVVEVAAEVLAGCGVGVVGGQHQVLRGDLADPRQA